MTWIRFTKYYSLGKWQCYPQGYNEIIVTTARQETWRNLIEFWNLNFCMNSFHKMEIIKVSKGDTNELQQVPKEIIFSSYWIQRKMAMICYTIFLKIWCQQIYGKVRPEKSTLFFVGVDCCINLQFWYNLLFLRWNRHWDPMTN